MICKNCGADVEGRFCSNCGYSLLDTEEFVDNQSETEALDYYENGDGQENEEAFEEEVPQGFYEDENGVESEEQNENEIEQEPLQEQPEKITVQKKIKQIIYDKTSRTKKVRKKRKHRIPYAGALSGIVCRYMSALLMAVVTIKLLAAFWARRNSLGSFSQIVAERNYALAAYGILAAVIGVYGCLSLLWILRRKKAANNRILGNQNKKILKYDSGRGIFSFLVFGIISGAAGSMIIRIPAQPYFLAGMREILQIFAEQKSSLLVICLAGMICCIIRKVNGMR